MPEPYNPVNRLFDTSLVRTESLNELASIFKTISTNITDGHLLVLQKSLSPIIDSLTSFTNLRKLTNIQKVVWIDENDEFNYDYDYFLQSFQSLVFLYDGDFRIQEQVSTILKRKLLPFVHNNQISLVITGNLEKTDELMLENLGLKGDVRLFHWRSLRPLLIEDDLISLNLKHGGLKELLNKHTIEPVEQLAQALLDLVLKSSYKIRITNTFLKGDNAIKLWSIYKNKFDKHMNSVPPKVKKVITDQDETLFLDQYSFFSRNVDFVCFDRGVDLVSCLLTQLTYTGLCDTTIGSELGVLTLKGDGEEGEEDLKIKLGDEKDTIYPLIKDLNFSMVGSVLNNKARLLQAEFDKRSSLTDIDEMKKFVGELNHLKESQKWVQKHTTLAESILRRVKENEDVLDIPELSDVELPSSNYFNCYIELQQEILSDNLDNKRNCSAILEFMYKFEPRIHDVVKLLVLTTIVKKGIREYEYDTLKSEILNVYGVRHVNTFLKLRELRLVYPRESVSFLSAATTQNEEQSFGPVQLIRDFRFVANTLNLMPIVDQPDLVHPKDADFGLPGYVPIVTRLVEFIYDRAMYTGGSTGNGISSLANSGAARAKKYGWDNLDLSGLNGEVKQEFLVPENKKNLFNAMIPPKLSHLKNRRDMVIVSVIGGLTYSEISTIRYVLGKNELTRSKQLVILTTGIITGDDVIESVLT